ncbi:MAG: hypothetical protein Tsb0020_31280 [Haliangiales bacterium]
MAASGCGGDSLSVDTATARGAVGGIVIDAASRQPLAGASIDLLAGDVYYEPVITDETGRFSFSSVPAGQFLITMAGPDSYQGAWVRGEIPASAGDFPSDNLPVTIGPVGLIQADQTLRVRIINQQGGPVSSYELFMRTQTQYIDFSDSRGVSAGEMLYSATTNADGYADFVGVPDFYRLGPEADDTLTFTLPPLDSEQDGVNEYPGGQAVIKVRNQDQPSLRIVLSASYNGVLEILQSSLQGFIDPSAPASVVAVNDVLSVLFSLPINGDVVVNVANESGQPLGIAPNVSVREDSLSIGFAAQPLTPGREFNLTIRASSSIGGAVVNGEFGIPFFTSGIEELSGTATELGSGDLEVVFSEPIGVGGGLAPVVAAGDCVVFVDADLNGSGVVGDAVNELGNDVCNIELRSAEPEPGGLAGLSGYTSVWQFTPPTIAAGAALPADTAIHVLLSQLSGDATIEFPDGDPATDVVIDGYTALP